MKIRENITIRPEPELKGALVSLLWNRSKDFFGNWNTGFETRNTGFKTLNTEFEIGNTGVKIANNGIGNNGIGNNGIGNNGIGRTGSKIGSNAIWIKNTGIGDTGIGRRVRSEIMDQIPKLVYGIQSNIYDILDGPPADMDKTVEDVNLMFEKFKFDMNAGLSSTQQVVIELLQGLPPTEKHQYVGLLEVILGEVMSVVAEVMKILRVLCEHAKKIGEVLILALNVFSRFLEKLDACFSVDKSSARFV